MECIINILKKKVVDYFVSLRTLRVQRSALKSLHENQDSVRPISIIANGDKGCFQLRCCGSFAGQSPGFYFRFKWPCGTLKTKRVVDYFVSLRTLRVQRSALKSLHENQDFVRPISIIANGTRAAFN